MTWSWFCGRGVITCGRPIPVSTEVYFRIHFKVIGTVWIQNKLVVAGSAEVSRKVLDGSIVRATGVLVESGDLVSLIGYATVRAIIEEVDIYNNGAVVEPIVEGRRWKISSDNHAGFSWRWGRRHPLREVHILQSGGVAKDWYIYRGGTQCWRQCSCRVSLDFQYQTWILSTWFTGWLMHILS